MKSVLISIQPKWCELIASGKKTVEVRKNRPRLKTPFKCYIYCTDGYVAPISFLFSKGLRKTVIGEFVCDSIDEYRAEFCDFKYSDTLSKNCALNQILKVVGFDQDNQTLLYQFESSNEIDNPDDCKLVINSNVTFNEIRKYIGETFFDKPFYGWNISNLIMYDKPKELSEFFVESNQTLLFSNVLRTPANRKCLPVFRLHSAAMQLSIKSQKLSTTLNVNTKRNQANIDMLQERQASLQKKHDKEAKAIDKQIKGYQNEIKAIKEAQKAAEEAKKANQKFTANFDELSTLGSADEADPYDTEIDKIQEKIDALQEEKEIKADIYETEREAIQEQIDLLQKSKDAIKDVDFSASIDGYEEKISAIREQIDALNDSLSENPQIEQNELLIEQLQEEIDLLEEKKDAIQEASNTAGNFDSSGITKFNDELDELKKKIEDSPLYQWIVDNKESIWDFVQIIGYLTVAVTGVYGAFKLFKGILSLFSLKGVIISAVLLGIAALISYGGNAQEVIDNLKQAFKLFGDGLTALIDGDFETFKQKFTEGFAYIENVGLAVWESLVNGLKAALRWILQKISAFEKSVPEDSVWHNFFGADWTLENWGWINEEYHVERKIPALAQGAVLPPNKPFYAMLGDQKNGTNLEAPASLIEDIMRGVLSEQQWNFNVNANGSLGALIRLLKLQFTRENDRETAF